MDRRSHLGRHPRRSTTQRDHRCSGGEREAGQRRRAGQWRQPARAGEDQGPVRIHQNERGSHRGIELIRRQRVQSEQPLRIDDVMGGGRTDHTASGDLGADRVVPSVVQLGREGKGGRNHPATVGQSGGSAGAQGPG